MSCYESYNMHKFIWYKGEQCIKLPPLLLRESELYEAVAELEDITEEEADKIDTDSNFVSQPIISLSTFGRVHFETKHYRCYQHPHVSSSGTVCWGTASQTAPKLFEQNILEYVETLITLLHNYERNAAYEPVYEIMCYGTSQCHVCGSEIDADDAIYLDGEPYCNDCAGWCGRCDEPYCNDDLHWSDTDDTLYCEGCCAYAMVSQRRHDYVRDDRAVWSDHYREHLYEDADDLISTEDDGLRWSRDAFCCEDCGNWWSEENLAAGCCEHEEEEETENA